MKINELLDSLYGLEALNIEKSGIGAGSDTWFVTCADGRYVVKFPSSSDINHPKLEPELCEYLNRAGIPVCRFIPDKAGRLLSRDAEGRPFHVQHFIEGRVYGLNEAPPWLMEQSAASLGRIHAALRDYPGLPTGIGAGFFRYMTPRRALESYRQSLLTAIDTGDSTSAGELEYRIALMERFPDLSFELDRLTCAGTHGDFFISQLICGRDRINAVIDWTTACVHPVVWEIIRSFVYAAPSCAGGSIDADELAAYVAEYMRHAPLGEYDLRCMVSLFYYQLAVCDYYNQYYSSDAHNRHIYLHQASFSTALLRCLERDAGHLTEKLLMLL